MCSRSTSSKLKQSKQGVVNANDTLNFDSSWSKCLNPNAGDVPVNSMPVNTAGAAGVLPSQAATQNQRSGWND